MGADEIKRVFTLAGARAAEVVPGLKFQASGANGPEVSWLELSLEGEAEWADGLRYAHGTGDADVSRSGSVPSGTAQGGNHTARTGPSKLRVGLMTDALLRRWIERHCADELQVVRTTPNRTIGQRVPRIRGAGVDLGVVQRIQLNCENRGVQF